MLIRKKLLVIFVSIVIFLFSFMSFFLCACNPKTSNTQFFNNFFSSSPYVGAEEKLKLSPGVKVESYDQVNEIFITKQEVLPNDTRLGFATLEQELVSPKYLQVLDIRGDYAIVTMPFTPSNIIETRVGVAKIRGKDKGVEKIHDMGFAAKFVPGISQYTFLDEQYLIVLGDKETSSTEYEYATIYNYTRANGLLEYAKVADIKNSTKFYCWDGYLFASTGNLLQAYTLNSIDSNGYLIRDYFYSPFDSEKFNSNQVEITPFYLGGNWFVFRAMYISPEEYEGYEMFKTMDEFNMTPQKPKDQYYISLKSKRYNANSKQAFDMERVAFVANKHTTAFSRDIAGMIALNSEYINTDNSELIQQIYHTPSVPTSELVRIGYSIVYIYYPNYDSFGKINFDVTFQIFNNRGEANIIKNMLLPVLYVDGVGLQNLDPNFSLPGNDIAYYDYVTGDINTIRKKTDTEIFDTIMIHSGVITVSLMDINNILSKKVAVYDIKTRRAITDFEYDSITPFFGDYALGCKLEDKNGKDYFKYYRLNRSGVAYPINDHVYSAHNGCYVLKAADKYSLFSNNGNQLILKDFINISVIEVFLKNSRYMESYVIATEKTDGVESDIIYRLK